MTKAVEFKARKISPGVASGPALVIRDRLSCLGGIDPKKGVFNRPGTELDRVSLAGKVLIFVSGKGSSSWSGHFKIACRYGSAPAAVVNLEIDPLVALACVMSDIPFVQVEDWGILEKVKSGDMVTVDSDGGIVRSGGAG